MTTAEAVEMWVTSTNIDSLSQDYTNLDDHFSQTTIDTPRFKPFTLLLQSLVVFGNQFLKNIINSLPTEPFTYVVFSTLLWLMPQNFTCHFQTFQWIIVIFSCRYPCRYYSKFQTGRARNWEGKRCYFTWNAGQFYPIKPNINCEGRAFSGGHAIAHAQMNLGM